MFKDVFTPEEHLLTARDMARRIYELPVNKHVAMVKEIKATLKKMYENAYDEMDKS